MNHEPVTKTSSTPGPALSACWACALNAPANAAKEVVPDNKESLYARIRANDASDDCPRPISVALRTAAPSWANFSHS